MARLALTARLALALFLTTLVAVPAAEATYPGQNGRIYFACRAVGGSFDGIDICAINPDGSGLVNLTNTPLEPEGTPSVSPDGRRVSFIRGTSDAARLWVMNADGSDARQITDVASDGTAWTPDGQRLAFRARLGPTSYEFRLVSASGGGSTVLAPATGTHSPPKYAADGRYVYSRSEPIPGSPGSFNEQVFVVSNGTETRVTPVTASANSFPTWSPSGGQIVYTRLDGGGYALFTASSGGGGAETPLTETPLLDEMWGSFSPDGSKLLYQRDDGGFLQEVLVIANADGSNPTPIPTPTLAQARHPFWAPVASGSSPAPQPQLKPPAPFTVKPSKKTLAAGKALTLTLGCNVAPRCVVTYGAAVSIPARVLAAKTFKVKRKTVRVANGKTKQVKLKLSKQAAKAVRKALKKGLKPKLKVVVTAKRPNGKLLEKSTLKVKLKS